MAVITTSLVEVLGDKSNTTWRHHTPVLPSAPVHAPRWLWDAGTSPVTPLQPLPTPGGPCPLKSTQSSIQSAEIRVRATSSLTPHGRTRQNWRQRDKDSPLCWNHFWDPDSVQRVDFFLEQQGAAPAEIKRWVWHLLLVSAPQRDGLFSVQFPFRFPAVAHAASLFSKVNFLHKTLCFPTHSFSHKEPEGVGSSLCFSLSTNYYGWMMKVSGQRCRVLTWCCFWFCGHVSKTNKVCRLTVEKGVIVNCIHLCTSRLNLCSSWGQWAASSFFSDAASWMDTQFG